MTIYTNNVKQILIRLGQVHPMYDSVFLAKKKYLIKKYAVLILGFFVEHMVSSAMVVPIWSRQFYFILYNTSIIMLKQFQFIITYDIIAVKLELLLDDLTYLNKIKYMMHPKTLEVKLKNVREFYEELHDSVTLINKTGAYTSLTLFTLMTCSFASMTYFFVLGILKNTQVISLFRKFMNFF